MRYLAGGRYLVYASPKAESGIIDCVSGKVIQVFDIGRYAAVSAKRHLLLAQGKAIDLSACRPYQGIFEMPKTQAVNTRDKDIPDCIGKAMEATSDKGLRKTSGRVSARVLKSYSGRFGAYGTSSDGRTFIYDYDKPGQVESVTDDLTRITTEVKMVVTDHYRTVIDILFFEDESHLVRLCKTGNSMAGAVEVYSLSDGKRYTLKMSDPPESVKIFEDEHIAIILDKMNRVFLSTLPNLDCKIQLLGATQISRQIHVDQQTKTLAVMTGEQIDSYDLRKILPDSIIPEYEEASKRFGISLKESEPLWDLLEKN